MLRRCARTFVALMVVSCAASGVSSPNQPPRNEAPASAPQACLAGAPVLAPVPEVGDEQTALIERDGPCLDGDVDVCRIHRPLFEDDDRCENGYGCEAWWVYAFEDGRLQGLGVYWAWIDVGEEDVGEFIEAAEGVACRLEAIWGSAAADSPTTLETAAGLPGQTSILARRRWDAGPSSKTWEVHYTPAHHAIVALAIDVGEAPHPLPGSTAP